MVILPENHKGQCVCDIGEYAGDKLHEWECALVACLLGECSCEPLESAT